MSEGFHYRNRGKAAGPSPARQRWLLVLGGLALAVAIVLVGREPAPPGVEVTVPPAEAMGRWTTRSPDYAGRALVVQEYMVVLELGERVPDDEGFIDAVRTWEEEGNTVVRLEYTTVDGPQELEMILEGPDRMRLRNPPEVVWTRSP